MKSLSILALTILAAACGSTVEDIPPSTTPAGGQDVPPTTAQGSVDGEKDLSVGDNSRNGSGELTPGGEDGPSTSPPKCAVKVAPKDVYCAEQPLGNAKDECAKFGLAAASKDDSLDGTSAKASRDAYVAIVKSGNHGCEPGDAAYRIYVDVQKGETLRTPKDQGISHITYCSCPKAKAPAGI